LILSCDFRNSIVLGTSDQHTSPACRQPQYLGTASRIGHFSLACSVVWSLEPAKVSKHFLGRGERFKMSFERFRGPFVTTPTIRKTLRHSRLNVAIRPGAPTVAVSRWHSKRCVCMRGRGVVLVQAAGLRPPENRLLGHIRKGIPRPTPGT
jgi:hypothetical protein